MNGHAEIEGTTFASTGDAVKMNGKATGTGTWAVKVGLAQMLKGGVIMDVVTAEQARIAEEAGACAGECTGLSLTILVDANECDT